jgi:hypothetical protein
MGKVIRLTEGDLVRIVKKVLNESDMNEQLSKILNSFIKKGSKFKPMIKQGLPLIDQLPSTVRTLINSFPTNVKVGDKLGLLFNSRLSDIRGLKHYVKSGGGNGITDTYVDGLIKLVSTPKGGNVNLRDVYTYTNFLKQELDNIKSAIPKPKQGGLLNQNKNYDKQMNDLYNKFYTETTTLNKFISDLENISKMYKPL